MTEQEMRELISNQKEELEQSKLTTLDKNNIAINNSVNLLGIKK